MVKLLTLSEGPAKLVLAPELGGAVVQLDVEGVPVLRPWDGASCDPFSMACNPLVPFSNRISKGEFEWYGSRHTVEPNLEGESLPIHGDGFQRRWLGVMAGNTAILDLPNGKIGPWHYQAQQRFELREASLCLALRVTNTSGISLPFGLGIHPWFPRTQQTKLQFDAESFWSEDEQHLPKEKLPLELHPNWSFSSLKHLPETWINNAYCNWKGAAQIHQGQGAMSCRVSTKAPIETAIVYSPSSRATFFCFEPVSHPVDAFHLDGHPGLRELKPGEGLTASIELSWGDTGR